MENENRTIFEYQPPTLGVMLKNPNAYNLRRLRNRDGFAMVYRGEVVLPLARGPLYQVYEIAQGFVSVNPADKVVISENICNIPTPNREFLHTLD